MKIGRVFEACLAVEGLFFIADLQRFFPRERHAAELGHDVLVGHAVVMVPIFIRLHFARKALAREAAPRLPVIRGIKEHGAVKVKKDAFHAVTTLS